MKQRLLTGLVLALVFIPLVLSPNPVFTAAMGVLALVAMVEYLRMLSHKHTLSLWLWGYALLFTIFMFIAIRALFVSPEHALWLLVVISSLYFIGLFVLVFKPTITFDLLSKTLFGMFYVALPFAAISQIHHLGLAMLFYVLLVAMLTDVFAYFSGYYFGKHKLAPDISPKKTIEGAIGGTLVAVIIASVFAYWQGLFDIEHTGLLVAFMVFTGVLISVVAQVGDLVASKLKRMHQIKDFSNLFPGHGGVLDRFDSTMFAALFLSVILMIMEFIL